MDKEIHGLQNCIDSIISAEDLSYLMLLCWLVIFIGQYSLQSGCNTVYCLGGFEIMSVELITVCGFQ